MDADGLDETRLTDTPQDEFAPAYSATGARIAFNRLGNDGRIGVWAMKADGTGRVQRTFGKIDFFRTGSRSSLRRTTPRVGRRGGGPPRAGS